MIISNQHNDLTYEIMERHPLQRPSTRERIKGFIRNWGCHRMELSDLGGKVVMTIDRNHEIALSPAPKH
ncbi:MAG TPA: hypothetical protein VFR01_07605 [Geobacterales bacterium]|nr:hypothetical protein [Geobacterales bacterium]